MSKQAGLPRTRRQVLATLATVGGVGLAGCGSTTDSSVGEPSEKDVPAPSVDTGDRWELTTPDSQSRVLKKGSVLGLDYQAVGHINRYEDTKLRSRIRDDTFKEVDRPFAAAFAARVDIFPSQASFATDLVGDIDETMTTNLKQSMQEFGVQNVQENGTMSVSNAPVSEVTQLVGEYQIEPVVIDNIDIPHSDKEQLQFGGGTLPIKGIVGNWKSDSSILVGGGVYPDGRFDQKRDIEMSDAITLSIDIDLHIRPRQRQKDVVNFLRSVSL